jgi:hypothetical protein
MRSRHNPISTHSFRPILFSPGLASFLGRGSRELVSSTYVLRRGPDLGVCEEESHGDQCADDHGVFPAQAGTAHVSCEYGAPDTAEVDERIVAPCDVWAWGAECCAPGA